MRVLSVLFEGNTRLSPALCNKMTEVLGSHAPNSEDTQQHSSWLRALGWAASRAGELNTLNTAINTLMPSLLRPSVALTASKALQHSCPRLWALVPEKHPMRCAVLNKLEHALTPPNASSFPALFALLRALYAAATAAEMSAITAALAALHQTTPTPDSLALLAYALYRTGTTSFFALVPWRAKDELLPRPWLIPVLRLALPNTALSFFTSWIIPLSKSIEAEASKFPQKEQKDIANCVIQLRSLFVPLCVLPRDAKKVWPEIASSIGSTITKDLLNMRTTMAHGLHVLIRSYRSAAKKQQQQQREEEEEEEEEGEVMDLKSCEVLPSAEEAAEVLAVIAKDSANLMPCLFNGYLKSEAPQLLMAVESLASISDIAVVNKFFVDAVKKALASQSKEAEETYLLNKLAASLFARLDVQNARYYWETLRLVGGGDKSSWRSACLLVRKNKAFAAAHRKAILQVLEKDKVSVYRCVMVTFDRGGHRKDRCDTDWSCGGGCCRWRARKKCLARNW